MMKESEAAARQPHQMYFICLFNFHVSAPHQLYGPSILIYLKVILPSPQKEKSATDQ